MNAKSVSLNIMALAFLAPYGAVLADQTKLPIIQVATDGATALAQGLSIGRQTKSLFPDIEARYDSALSSLVNQRQLESLRKAQLPNLFERLDKSHQEEIQGVEAAWELVSESNVGDGKLSAEEYRLLNFLPDLGFMPNGSGFAAIDKASSDNKPILGRNLDWKVNSTFKSLQSITVYKGDEHTSVNIGFAGLVLVVTGYNSDGLFLAGLNAAPYSPYYQTSTESHKKQTSASFDFKTLLDSKKNSKQALKYLSATRYPYDINIIVADKKTVTVLEHSKNGSSQVRHWNSPLHANTPWGKRQQIGVVNCFTLLSMPNSCQSASNSVRWKRLRNLANFDAQSPASLTELSSLMTDTQNKRHEIFNNTTLQSVIYQPASGKLYLYANLDGTNTKTPVYQAYFDFADTLVKSTKESASYFSFKKVYWLLIALLGAALWWFMRKRT